MAKPPDAKQDVMTLSLICATGGHKLWKAVFGFKRGQKKFL
jgi:hypothetical protein